jgi:hypothetical protein
VLNYHAHADVVYGLTWTDNDEAENGSVRKMIEHYLPKEVWEQAKYFGGHRPVSNTYYARAGGLYLQIHNPQKFQVGYVRCGEVINAETCIIEIGNRTRHLSPGLKS